MISSEELVTTLAANLRKTGRRVGVGESIDAVTALNILGKIDRELLKAVLKTTLVKDNTIDLRDSSSPIDEGEKIDDLDNFPADDSFVILHDFGSTDHNDEDAKTSLYSPVDNVQVPEVIDGNTISVSQRRTWISGVRRFRESIATLEGQRRRLDETGAVNLRRTFRLQTRGGGETNKLIKTSRRITKGKVVLFCDISGSMKNQLVFVSNLAYWLKRYIPRTEVFLFSTKITRITKYAERLSPSRLQSLIGSFDTRYGSGTRLGQCLDQLMRSYSNLFQKDSTLVIFSDGWDVGDLDLLKSRITEAYAKCHRIVWINPLKSEVDYSPESLGIRTCLPCVDSFLSPLQFLGSKSFWTTEYNERKTRSEA